MQSTSRRTFLAIGALAAAGLLAACTSDADDKSSAHGRAGAPKDDQDPALRARAVAGADALLARYAAVPAGSAGPVPLAQLQAEVTGERAALAAGLPSGSASGAATGSAATSPSGSPSGSAGAAGSGATGLAAAEKGTAQARLADLSTASPELARLLASVAAAGALRAVRLGDPTPLPAPPGDAPPTAAPTGSPSPAPAADAPSAGATTALQAALAAEHAAVYAFGVVGAKIPPGPKRDDARACYVAHQARRDAWDRLLAGAGATPAAAAPGYRLPFAVPDATAAGQLAAEVEHRLAAVYGDLVAATAGELRARAAAALRTAALQCAHWGGTPGPLPGMPAAAGSPSPQATGTKH